MWGNKKRFTMEQMKVIFALSYMKDGTTEHWRNMRIQEMMDNKWGCTDSWNALAAQLEKDFHDANLADNRLTEVEMLRQGTGSADEYTVKFNTLIEETNIKEDASRLRYYMKGINEALVYKVYGLIPIPDTLALWQEKAIMYDNQWRQAKQFTAWRGGKTTNPPSVPKTSKARDPDAMDVDRSKLRKLTNEEREKLWKEKGCFACREPGHIAKNCLKKGKGKERVRKVDEEDPCEEPSRNPSPPSSTASFDSCGSEGPPKGDHPPPYQGIKATRTQIKKLLASLSHEDKRRALDDFSDEEDF